MVLTVQENEDGQAATLSGAINTSVIENIELHATVDTDTVTDYMEEIKDEDLDLSQSKQLCNEVLCTRKLTKDDVAEFAAYASLTDTEQSKELCFV